MLKTVLPLILLYALWPTASSAERLAEHTIPETVTFAAYDNPPWYMHDDNNEPIGVIPHYTQQLASQTKYKARIVTMPYQRVIQSTDDKNIDFVVSIEHPDLFKKAYPYMKLGRIATVVYSALPLDDLLAQNKQRKPKVGILRGTMPLAKKLAPAELLEAWDIVEFNTEESGFNAAQIGRLDAAILTRNGLEYLLEKKPSKKPSYVEDLGFFTVFAWLPKRIKLNHQLIKMRKKIEEMTHDGRIVLDWRSALNQFDNSTATQPLLDHSQNAEMRKLLDKIQKK